MPPPEAAEAAAARDAGGGDGQGHGEDPCASHQPVHAEDRRAWAPAHGFTAGSEPRNERATAGSRSTRVGIAGGDDPAEVEGHQALGDGPQQRHVVLDHQEARPERVAQVDEERRQRLRFPLRDAARRLVEEQHRRLVRERAREVDDAARAGRELVQERVGVRVEPEARHQLVDATRDRGLGARHRRQVQRGRDGILHAHGMFERDRDRLADGERGEEPAVLERPAHAVTRAPVGRAGARGRSPVRRRAGARSCRRRRG